MKKVKKMDQNAVSDQDPDLGTQRNADPDPNP